MVEHRNGFRLPLRFTAQLWCGGRQYGSYTTRDISHGGLFIEDCQAHLSSGDFVSIKLTTGKLKTGPATQQADMFIMRALVVHVCDSGAGLMWADSNESFYRVLDNLADLAA
ncbi:PilZ domain-containing protein [Exilibacterium tricleocarpae]|uniref:PilZ domain-containing protein n=1 Tax=Exilibacterium tricleocarpae TaxID=2591008 RepID=A0A545SYZ6_9GAMM|nr:PilZ domain-containing protein [Exilibacterium tricleocarpae]TQV70196.1 PilZ domain-containing protein [Exilibacterium tricleocarpae]